MLIIFILIFYCLKFLKQGNLLNTRQLNIDICWLFSIPVYYSIMLYMTFALDLFWGSFDLKSILNNEKLWEQLHGCCWERTEPTYWSVLSLFYACVLCWWSVSCLLQSITISWYIQKVFPMLWLCDVYLIK